MGTDPEQFEEVGKPNYGGASAMGKLVVRLFGADPRQRRWVEGRFCFAEDGATRVVCCLSMRYPFLALSCSLLPVLIFFAGVIAVSMLGGLFVGTPFDWMGWLLDLAPPWGSVCLIMIGYGIPFIIGLLVYRAGLHAMRRKIEIYLTTPECIYCGYDLSANNPSGDAATCTECGSVTPVVHDG